MADSYKIVIHFVFHDGQCQSLKSMSRAGHRTVCVPVTPVAWLGMLGEPKSSRPVLATLWYPDLKLLKNKFSFPSTFFW